MSEKTVVTSEISITIKVIGGKWKPLILQYLRTQGTRRYSEILRYLENAPKKTLTAQLRELEEDGIIARNVIPSVPPQVEYSLTSHGETLNPVLDAMCQWGFRNRGGNYILSHPTCTEEGKKK
ncbi:MAG: winged helix-turn-helix transcriptional regulator [Lachnospiraceae bacterium]|nr:winged helix-turn-helix transcriptional regulator [Lachnospiraceae bacterium]